MTNRKKNPALWLVFGFGLGALFPLLLGLTEWLPSTGAFLVTPARILLLGEPLVLGGLFFAFGKKMNTLSVTVGLLEKRRTEMESEISSQYQRLGDSERALRTIIDHLDTGICTVDRDLRIDKHFNSEFTRLFGRSDMAGKRLQDTVFGAWTERQKADLREAVELAFATTASSDDMLNDVLPSRELISLGAVPGDVKYVHVTLSRLYGASGVEKVMFIFRDVTLARKLKEEEERHQRILDDQYRRIHQLLKHERNVVFGFFASFAQGMDGIASKIKQLSQGEANAAAVREIIGQVHSIKGEAFSLDFEALRGKNERF